MSCVALWCDATYTNASHKGQALMNSSASRACKVVSLINMKGGVGKTTLAVGLAWELAQKHNVLLVDVDPQFNATQWLVDDAQYLSWLNSSSKRTVFDVYAGEDLLGGIGGFGDKKKTKTSTTLKNAVMQVTHKGVTLDIVPSSLELITLDAARRGTENRLNLFLQPARQKYEFVIIDCPPTASLFSLSAHIASDAYLVPIKPDPLSVLGLPLLERTIADYTNSYAHTVERLGLVPTMFRKTNAMRKALRHLRTQYAGEVYSSVIHQTTGVAEAVERGLPLQIYSKTRNNSNVPLGAIAAEFLKRQGGV